MPDRDDPGVTQPDPSEEEPCAPPGAHEWWIPLPAGGSSPLPSGGGGYADDPKGPEDPPDPDDLPG